MRSERKIKQVIEIINKNHEEYVIARQADIRVSIKKNILSSYDNRLRIEHKLQNYLDKIQMDVCPGMEEISPDDIINILNWVLKVKK